MPKDYKNINKKNSKSGSLFGSVMTFLTGLTAGLLIAFLAFLYNQEYQLPFLGTDSPQDGQNKSNTPVKAVNKDEKSKIVKPEFEFEFFNILPNREVNISEWIAEDQEKENAVSNKSDIFILQVGSFTQYETADQLKAQLALLGIDADIQRVVINGQDVRHRVRVGPFKDIKKFNETRQRLRENHLDFMILKLKLEDLAASTAP